MTRTPIRCNHCGQTYDLTPEQVPQYAGRTITCTNCRQPFTVQTPGAAAGAAPPPQQQQPDPLRYAQPAAHPAEPQQPNPLATASMIVGFISFCLPILGSIPAIVLGILGLGKTRDPRVGGKGLAITGIVLGGLSMLITPCMISILLPSLNRARETANRVKCASNMRQIGLALLQYGNKNRGAYPHDLQALANAMPAEVDASFFVCPSSNDTAATTTPYTLGAGTLSYVYVPGLNTSASSEAILLYEPLTNHDNDGTNIVFGDGHVEFITRRDAEPMIAAVEAGQNPPPRSGQTR